MFLKQQIYLNKLELKNIQNILSNTELFSVINDYKKNKNILSYPESLLTLKYLKVKKYNKFLNKL